MTGERVAREVSKRVRRRDGRSAISCSQAHRLAAELGVAVKRIGEVCEADGIKIVHCQLGCFGERRHG